MPGSGAGSKGWGRAQEALGVLVPKQLRFAGHLRRRKAANAQLVGLSGRRGDGAALISCSPRDAGDRSSQASRCARPKAGRRLWGPAGRAELPPPDCAFAVASCLACCSQRSSPPSRQGAGSCERGGGRPGQDLEGPGRLGFMAEVYLRQPRRSLQRAAACCAVAERACSAATLGRIWARDGGCTSGTLRLWAAAWRELCGQSSARVRSVHSSR